MNSLQKIQTLQLRLIESAAVNENCASDLLSLLRKLTAAEAINVLSMVAQLQTEAEFLRKHSKEMALDHYRTLAK